MTDGKQAPGEPKKRPGSAWIPKRPDKRGAAPAMLGEVLVGVDSFLAKRSGAAIARAEWCHIVGARIAGRTRVGNIYKGVLTIKVASSAWSNELSFLKGELLTKLKRAGHEVADLRFQVDKFADDAPATKVRPGAPRRPEAPGQTPLPPELVARLQKVEDPNLRAAIAEAARWSLKNKS